MGSKSKINNGHQWLLRDFLGKPDVIFGESPTSTVFSTLFNFGFCVGYFSLESLLFLQQ